MNRTQQRIEHTRDWNGPDLYRALRIKCAQPGWRRGFNLADSPSTGLQLAAPRNQMPIFDRMKARWGVGPGGLLAILVAFSLAGLTTVRLKGPVIGFLLPASTPGWVEWTVYLIIMLPIYQLLLLGYGTLLGQFDFFWSKLKAVGRLLSRRTASASG